MRSQCGGPRPTVNYARTCHTVISTRSTYDVLLFFQQRSGLCSGFRISAFPSAVTPSTADLLSPEVNSPAHSRATVSGRSAARHNLPLKAVKT